MLGYEVDFGHREVIELVGSSKYSEKQVGYVAMSLLLKSGDALLQTVAKTIRNDLISSTADADAGITLALCSIANVQGIDLMKVLHVEVQQTLVSKRTSPAVKKKAALCLLRLIRQIPDTIASQEFAEHIATLMQERHLGVLCSTMSLLIGMTSKHEEEYSTLIPYAIHILVSLVVQKNCSPDYLYYRTPSPWLQVKLLRFLQYYPNLMQANQPFVQQLRSVLQKILTETDVSDSINKSNADHAILFEAVNLIVIWGDAGDKSLRDAAMRLLGKFISVREPNIRYLGLMTMARLANLHDVDKEQIKRHQQTVLISLKDADISVRKRALNLLFVMCDESNAEVIVDELITYLVAADAGIREQMVLKIAILAEKYSPNLKWYVDTILKLISLSGDHVSDSIWHRVVQIVTNSKDDELQTYAAERMFSIVSNKRCHETAVKIGGYVLGEFGFLVAEEPGMSGDQQFKALHQHFSLSNNITKGILLSSYAKLANLYEECRPLVEPVFESLRNASDIELQQRSNEYRVMREVFPGEVVEDLLREMPAWEVKEKTALEQRLNEEDHGTEDKNVWVKGKGEGGSKGSGINSPTSPSRAVNSQQQAAVEEPDLLGSYDDDTGGVNAPPPPPPPPPPEPQRQVAAASDLLGIVDDDNTNNELISTKPNPNNAPNTITADLLPQMRTAFSKLCISPAGVLFENPIIQVGVKHEYRGSQGRVQIFFGNNSASSQMTNFKADIPSVPYLRVQAQGTDGITAGTATIAPKTQGKLQLMVEVLSPFADAAEIRLSFALDGVQYDYPLRLPVVATCFNSAVTDLDAGNFMQRWKALTGDKEQQEIVQKAGIDEAMMSKLAAAFSSGFRFSKTPGLDATPNTLSGAATFRSGAKDQNGNPITVGCLLRIEANMGAGAFRVTARTLHPTCSKAVKNVVVATIKHVL